MIYVNKSRTILALFYFYFIGFKNKRELIAVWCAGKFEFARIAEDSSELLPRYIVMLNHFAAAL